MRTRVLFVDDDSSLREALAELLPTAYGVEIVCAGSLRELAALRRTALACDLAILDVNMGAGEPSGLEVRKWLLDAGFKGKVVFLTGHAKDHPLVDQAVHLGGAAVYEKPIGVLTLIKLIEESRAARAAG
jgi:FixJ family two-component response regulator